MTSERFCYLHVTDQYTLHQFGGNLRNAFPTAIGILHVGSSVTRPNWRDVDVRIVPFTLDFTADSYVDLLRTYSDHITLPPDELQRLLDGVRTLITERFGGRLRREWCTVVFLGRRKEDLNLTV